MLQHWIWLATRKHVSDGRKMELLEHFSDPEQIYFSAKRDFEAMELTSGELESLQDKNLDDARKILDDCAGLGIHVMTIHDGIYPKRLKNIPDPPVVLYYKGRMPVLDDMPTIGVVGTRKASLYGLNAAKKMGYQIAACGGVLVSGLAEGIDALAMQGALTAGGTVVGILGCGCEQIYPKCNRALFGDTEHHGCIISPFPPGTPPRGFHFPIRNRLISGISDGVLVVEAPDRSGALITANHAAEQGRDVFVVPGNIDVPSAVGSNALLRDGGISVSSGWDVVSEYQSRYPGKITKNTGGAVLRPVSAEAVEATAQVAQKVKKVAGKPAEKQTDRKKVIDKRENEPYIDFTKISGLTEQERKLLTLLEAGPAVVDELMARSELNPAVVNSSLTMLEIKGFIRRLPGKFIELSGKN